MCPYLSLLPGKKTKTKPAAGKENGVTDSAEPASRAATNAQNARPSKAAANHAEADPNTPQSSMYNNIDKSSPDDETEEIEDEVADLPVGELGRFKHLAHLSKPPTESADQGIQGGARLLALLDDGG